MFLLSVVFSEECDFAHLALPLSVFHQGANQMTWVPFPPLVCTQQKLFRFVFTAGSEETARIRGPGRSQSLHSLLY